MRELTVREKVLLGACIGAIFIVVNGFAARSILKNLSGGDGEIRSLRSQLADHEMRLEDAPAAEAREKWLIEMMPRLGNSTLGKEQGDLLQALQDECFERKLTIERQSLQEIEYNNFYTEVAVRLEIKGDEAVVTEWLTTLQGPEKFQVIKNLEIELDLRSREPEPQAECEITVAKWFVPDSSGVSPAESDKESSGEQG